MMKNADLLFTVPDQVPFWTTGQFELLIIAVVLPLSHVPRYTGPWLVKGTDKGNKQTLQKGCKGGEPDDSDKCIIIDLCGHQSQPDIEVTKLTFHVI
jgi:hypothetical protein